jgi:predicted lipoprotein with Yx(FWY)xxD motif
MKYQMKIMSLAMMCVTLSVLSSCSKNDTTTPPDTNPGGGGGETIASATIKLAEDPLLGTILTDSLGKTLYFFAYDADGTSGCLEGCIVSWPVFYREYITLNTRLDANDFGVITRKDGLKQNTYKGWPLYYYNGDSKKGDVKGDGSVGTWFVAKPDYTFMLANIQLKGEDAVEYNHLLQPGTEITQYLTDDYGRTLYFSANDADKTNNYSDDGFLSDAIWPIFKADTILAAPSVLNKAAFGKITVFGKTQLTYKGWPLYHYANDSKVRGNTKGVSIKTPAAWSYANLNTSTAPASK